MTFAQHSDRQRDFALRLVCYKWLLGALACGSGGFLLELLTGVRLTRVMEYDIVFRMVESVCVLLIPFLVDQRHVLRRPRERMVLPVVCATVATVTLFIAACALGEAADGVLLRMLLVWVVVPVTGCAALPAAMRVLGGHQVVSDHQSTGDAGGG